jgi:endonuclease/exonuclease/phosphatase family metal-dependent hydrolase
VSNSYVKALSYNILNGGERRLWGIAGVIREQRPDVVAVLEANRRVNAMLLARLVGMRLVFAKANSSFHVAWLTSLPVVRSENHRLPGLTKTLLEVEVCWDDAPLRLFATHLAGGADAVHPAEEMPLILDVLGRVGDGPHLLAGDLNAIHPDDEVGQPPPGIEDREGEIDADPRQAIRDILAAGYTDCFRALHPHDPGYTFPSERPWLRLDYIFASPGLAPRLAAAGCVDCPAARKASDHLPVWAEFR